MAKQVSEIWLNKSIMRIIIISFLISGFFLNDLFGAREITNFDIARWYLDSDIVMICRVDRIDTLNIFSVDSLTDGDYRVRGNQIQEQYVVTVDSVLKDNSAVGLPQLIYSQPFMINYSKSKTVEDAKYTGLDSNGDSIFVMRMELYGSNCTESYYFRLTKNKTFLVILSRHQSKLIIDYQTICNKDMLKMFSEIELKGESYFIFKKQSN